MLRRRGGGESACWARRPVSRVLCRPPRNRFLADAAAIPLDRPSPAGSRDAPGPLEPATVLPCAAEASQGARPLFGLAPGGACHAIRVAEDPVRSYRTLSPLPPAPRLRRAKTLRSFSGAGGLLSVALSLGSLPAGVARRLVTVEPGLSSTPLPRRGREPRPPSRLARTDGEACPASGQRRTLA